MRGAEARLGGMRAASERPLLIGIVVLAACLALVAWRQLPPAPLDARAAAAAFSAERAATTLARLLGEGASHPVGSATQATLRARLEAELRSLGLRPELQAAFACSDRGACARVENVLAVREGREAGPLVLLMAHYDSVPTGPGASDDGAGCAALLEVARALATARPGRNGVAFLFTDGEEAGLLGAQAFADEHPSMRRVGAIVNVEARGTAGRSLLFETSGPGSTWLSAQAAAALSRPAASSLFAAVYERLPNDTDLSVFKRRAVPGLNLAFIGEPRRYHTPRDDLAHLDRGSLQHQGDNLLALARHLSQADLAEAARPGRSVFFDLLGLWLVRWPEAFGPWLAGLALGVLAVSALRQGARPAGVGLTLVALLVALGAAGVAQYAAGALWRATAPGPRAWVAGALAVEAAAWGSGLLGAALGGQLARWRSNPAERATALGLAWSVAALAVSLLLPGASYVVLVPALAAAVAGLAAPAAPLAALLPVVASALVILPLQISLVDSLGLAAAPLSAALAALVAAGLWPLLPSRPGAARLALPPALLLAACAAAVALLPPDSVDRPQGLSLTYVEESQRGTARLGATPESERLPAGVAAAAPFHPAAEPLVPWARRLRGFTANVEPLGLPAPGLELLDEARVGAARRLRLRISSPRGAPALILSFPFGQAPSVVRMDGRPVALSLARARRRAGGHVSYSCLTVPPEGLVVELELGGAPVELILADRSLGLPAAWQAVAAARPPDAVPIHEGDTTIVLRRIRL